MNIKDVLKELMTIVVNERKNEKGRDAKIEVEGLLSLAETFFERIERR